MNCLLVNNHIYYVKARPKNMCMFVYVLFIMFAYMDKYKYILTMLTNMRIKENAFQKSADENLATSLESYMLLN